MDMKKVNILGVEIDNISQIDALAKVEEWLKGTKKHYIVTPNPEFVMAARKDIEFKIILNNADLAIADGVGLKLASDIVSTITGIDFLESLVKLSSEKGFTVGFLGGKDMVAKKTAECLQKKYQNLKVVFASDGPRINSDGNQINKEDLGFRIYDLRNDALNSYILNLKSLPPVDILFVAFGQVKQEKWIAKNLDKIPVKVAMGVGGAFDYLSGQVPRAPKFMRNLGLEWLFRLIMQPWRIKRQFSLIKFAFLVISRYL